MTVSRSFRPFEQDAWNRGYGDVPPGVELGPGEQVPFERRPRRGRQRRLLPGPGRELDDDVSVE